MPQITTREQMIALLDAVRRGTCPVMRALAKIEEYSEDFARRNAEDQLRRHGVAAQPRPDMSKKLFLP
jgi:hypothetical protein